MDRKRQPGEGREIVLSWPEKGALHEHTRGRVTADDLMVIERLDARCCTPSDVAHAQASLPLAQPAHAPGAAADHLREPNMLILGDNLVTMDALAHSHRERFGLIYLDPPFATGLSYYSQTDLGEGSEGALERRAYRDNRAGGMAGYLERMLATFRALHPLLAPHGKLFVHCDWRANSMLRLLLDEVFGPECFRNEIVWRRAPNLGRQAASRQLGRVFDSIYVYSKEPGTLFAGPAPRRRSEVALDAKGKPRGARWDDSRKAYFTTAPRGDYTDDSIAKLRSEGRVFDSSTGTVYIKYFLTEGDDGRWYKEQPVDALWDDFEVRPLRHRPKAEDMGYDTQKPLGLLERIVRWASGPDDWVGDFFCGSGTTLAAAEALGRPWVGCDIGSTAIDVCRRRLLDRQERDGQRSYPFEVRSVTRAERRLWAEEVARGDEGEDARRALEAFGAEPTGERGGTHAEGYVWVAPVSARVGQAEVTRACEAAVAGGHQRLVILAWEWGEPHAAALRQLAREAFAIDLVQRGLPLELLRPDGLRRGLRFAERAEVEVAVTVEATRRWRLRLTDVRCPDPPPLRGDARGKGGGPALPWSELIDAWMVDWGSRSEAFVPAWRSARSRHRPLELETPAHELEPPHGDIRVKVFTVFGDEILHSIAVDAP
jgi:DNA modification methylase